MSVAADDVRTADNPAWVTSSIDIARCGRLEIVTPFHEWDDPGVSFETWPQDVKRRMVAELAAWQEKNPHREPVATTTGLQAGTCVLILHHKPRTP